MREWKPKDIAVLMLSITVSTISIMAMIGIIFFDEESGRLEELIAFLLGSMTTIIGEYVLLHLKNNNQTK
tara:strand:+ start:4705 stop:4914 length:210 start_codon:yes stop_codon:yes gene_type:complete